MLRPSLLVVLHVALLSVLASAQSLCPNGVSSKRLICLIPQVYGPNGLSVQNPNQQGDFGVNFLTSSLSSLQSSIARQSALLPLASPSSGITFSWDAAAKGFVASTDSYGPILGERAETIGKYRVFLGFDYQYFNFSTLDGIGMTKLPVVLPQNDFTLQDGTVCTLNGTIDQQTGQCGFIRDVITTRNRIDLKIHQFTTFITVGVTDRLDVSVAIPIENVRLGMTSTATVSHNDSDSRFAHAFAPGPDCPNSPPDICLVHTFSNPGTASGIGDITLRVKGSAWKGEHAALAIGVDVRAPTGDSLDYLGAGAAGVKPFVIWSYRSRVSPHAFVGYDINGSSRIAGDISTGSKERLPGDLTYSGGVDFWLTKRLTVAADMVGQQMFQAQRTSRSTFTEPGQCQDNPATLVQCDPNFGPPPFLPPKHDDNLTPSTDTFNITNLSVGVKLKPFSTLLVTGNVLIRLNDGGLRSKFVPLVGMSYTF
jgi:Putative MetA-pathway of phenol degradation